MVHGYSSEGKGMRLGYGHGGEGGGGHWWGGGSEEEMGRGWEDKGEDVK